jgi:hypothetical protein
MEKAVRRELEQLNREIDVRIIKGLSYAREARRHKFLKASLARMRAEQDSSRWFGTFKLASIIS